MNSVGGPLVARNRGEDGSDMITIFTTSPSSQNPCHSVDVVIDKGPKPYAFAPFTCRSSTGNFF